MLSPGCTLVSTWHAQCVCVCCGWPVVQKVKSIPSPRLGLIKEGKPTAVDALQLCSLLLPQTNRTRLHRVLRLIQKASYNRQLILSKTKSNRDVLLDHFATIVLKSAGHSSSPLHIPSFIGKSDQGVGGASGCGPEEEKANLKQLVGFMAQHYQQIFKVCCRNIYKECASEATTLLGGLLHAGSYNLEIVVQWISVYYHRY